MHVLIEPTQRYLACVVCGCTTFDRREVKMNTTGASFLGFDWANRSGDGAICTACGYVHTFLGPGHSWVNATS
ncbi:hypothetical protein TPB0596_43570 [Tsukamurella pulmonis]|uniref:zinc ribbon domain-containing protein n=1 Tax=Tsukamurella pulmonis TaxID=47312 RepID=UPI001EDD74D6|nr:zinc ribbon domain-containing protein [Tsukamurella pulmonis]BDD84594.1 hypothetical protein TPB0596_43570 [Tsukamurella pulmonis]